MMRAGPGGPSGDSNTRDIAAPPRAPVHIVTHRWVDPGRVAREKNPAQDGGVLGRSGAVRVDQAKFTSLHHM
ncbi:hypothetical protein GCM10022629_51920 [Amorphoplanes auranticolor]